MTRRLSRRGKRRKEFILTFVKGYMREHGYSPAIRDIAMAMVKAGIGSQGGKMSTSMVHFYLGQLEEDGAIELDHAISRGIRLLDSSVMHSIPNLIRIPIVGKLRGDRKIQVPE